jgi:hypothetical protein
MRSRKDVAQIAPAHLKACAWLHWRRQGAARCPMRSEATLGWSHTRWRSQVIDFYKIISAFCDSAAHGLTVRDQSLSRPRGNSLPPRAPETWKCPGACRKMADFLFVFNDLVCVIEPGIVSAVRRLGRRDLPVLVINHLRNDP